MLDSVNKKAFTLIELLVVVAIIVILLAILVPSLSKALYRAELASCAAQLDGMGSAVITYAHANKSRYPYRSALDLEAGRDEGAPVYLVFSGPMGILQYTNAAGRNDDRPIYTKIMGIKTFADPFCPEIDLEDPNSQQMNDDVYSSYDLLWGWGYSGEGKMLKAGDAVTWENPGSRKLHKWNILAMDRDTFAGGNGLSSHPDFEGRLSEDLKAPQSTEGFDVWGSQWSGGNGAWTVNQRGKLDRNFLYDDGSVSTIEQIVSLISVSTSTSDTVGTPVGTVTVGGSGAGGTIETGAKPADERMDFAPYYSDGVLDSQNYVLMPASR